MQSGAETYTVQDMDKFQAQRQICTVRRLSEVMREENIEYIDYLKVDVQRAEMDVLNGIDHEDWRKGRTSCGLHHPAFDAGSDRGTSDRGGGPSEVAWV